MKNVKEEIVILETQMKKEIQRAVRYFAKEKNILETLVLKGK